MAIPVSNVGVGGVCKTLELQLPVTHTTTTWPMGCFNHAIQLKKVTVITAASGSAPTELVKINSGAGDAAVVLVATDTALTYDATYFKATDIPLVAGKSVIPANYLLECINTVTSGTTTATKVIIEYFDYDGTSAG